MKKIVLISLVCVSVFLMSQNKQTYSKIVYESTLGLNNKLNIEDYTLIFDNTFSVYYQSVYFDSISSSKEEIDDLSNITISTTIKPYQDIYYSDFVKDSIYSQGLIVEDKRPPVIIQEKIEKIAWQIKNKFKTINELEVQKAVGEFRGRTYTVWFTNDIPVRYGPWKLNGLPGLILSAIDETEKVSFNVKSIEIPMKGALPKDDCQFEEDAQKVSLKEFLEQQKQASERLAQAVMSKMPRGPKLVSVKTTKGETIEIFDEE